MKFFQKILNVCPIKEVLAFLLGFAMSALIVRLIITNNKVLNRPNSVNLKIKNPNYVTKDSYETKLADQLYKEVRILCMVFTHPDNRKTKVPYIINTWGKKCNKLILLSTKNDSSIPEIIALNHDNGRKNLWKKTRLALEYVYKNHFNDADWFLRADDDNYIQMENLRYKLYQYHPQTSLYIGSRFAIHKDDISEGYMAGGGNVLSKKALKKFATFISRNETLCNAKQEAGDVMVGRCIQNFAIFVDARDSQNQKQIFPAGVIEHMKHKEPDMKYWYFRYLYRNVTQGGLDCCSDIFIGSHYVKSKGMYFMDYLINNVHPFGLMKNVTEALPRKLSLDEIIASSDKISFAENFVPHKSVHFIDDDEKY
ncbi:unnamed protein product [Chironomus riparius]|uniref:N-acetylgalactosaminide beta-1,3-galactosyltransferase n=1 Tax=Chironomus riparius TaxID=315576 RepID=A0A9N9RNN1_9DIPT|nr:unnamed protein product [Chironomus riparius]